MDEPLADPVVALGRSEPLGDEPIVLAGPGVFCVDPAGADSGAFPAEWPLTVGSPTLPDGDA
jgi:hypothetical protein